MNKKTKLFLKIVYYVFTFGLGIVLVLVLPGIFFYENLALEMEKSLNEARYSDAMKLIGGYYDEEYVYQSDFIDGSGVVIFKAATLFVNEDEDATQTYNIQESYAGFLYKSKNNYLVKRTDNNQTKIIVTDLDGNKVDIDILNYDSDGDEKFDTVSTLEEFSYVYFDLSIDKISSLNKIEFIDREGNKYQTIDNLGLDFNEQFFIELKPFIEEYNNNSGSELLKDYHNEFISKKDSYKMGNYGDIQSQSNKKATIIVLVYFIWIYVLGDFLVGKRYILHFFKWMINKIRGKSEEPNKEIKNTYSNDYYCQLTFVLNVDNDCDINVSIKYHNENFEIEMILTKDNNYEIQKRVHAGKYVNAWLECPGYQALNLPKTLDVRGYKMKVEVTLERLPNENGEIIKEEENENKN
ncbi:MAG: hypothetical protein ACI35S_00250 [Anaeroplasma sp.]